MEQLGNSLKTEQERLDFQQGFYKMSNVVDAHNATDQPDAISAFLPSSIASMPLPLMDKNLYAQQIELSNILESAKNYSDAQTLLQLSSLAHTN